MKTETILARFSVLLVLFLFLFLPVLADDVVQETLRPPKGAQTALVVFEDLQCPVCGRVAPLLDQASRVYKIPLVQYDFPLAMHNWSFDAAVIARYFDTRSKELGNQFRLAVFEHQTEIISPLVMHTFAEKFASDHKLSLPFAVDKDPKLIALVNADKDIGLSLHIDKTPTIFIVSRHPDKPYVEVKDPSQLYVMIDAMK